MTSAESSTPNLLALAVTHDPALNFAFQQNAIPVVKELRFQNDGVARKNLVICVTTEPAFAAPVEIRVQAIAANGEFRVSPLDLKLSPGFLSELNEKVAGWLKVEVVQGDTVLCARTEAVSLLARNEWCGLVSLPEILAAFILPNDPAVMPILSRASDLLRESTGRAALNGYQDKSRKRAWAQVAAIYRAVAELGIRYINPPASFENSGQKVSFPSRIVAERFGTCLDLTLLFAACCERAGLHPLVLMHEGHAYAGCWLEERTFPDSAAEGADALQQCRKLETEQLITVFETTIVASETPGQLGDAERLAREHLQIEKPFRLALDVHRARIARIVPLPIPGMAHDPSSPDSPKAPVIVEGIGDRDFAEPINSGTSSAPKPATRIDQWKSRLLDLSLRNRLLNFKETKSTIRLLSAAPEHVEDELAAETELALRPKPKLMSEDDPRHGATLSKQQRADALAAHLVDELKHDRLHTHLDESEHARRLTELFRAARNALEENGTNTLFAAVGLLEWRETEHSDRIYRAPLLLVPVELKRKSVLEGFSLRRIDEETRLNVTLMEMLRQNFHKEVPGLDPLPEDETGADVARVFQLFRDAVRDLPGWEVKTEIWLGQFSFTKFLLWKDLADRLDDLTRNRIVNHLVNAAGTPYANPPDDIKPPQLDDQFHPRDVFCPRSADSSQLAAVMAAAAGHDFVLEGPPGTGKSQTITNIIAHCLAHGKRVLFVAEKRAALDVVHRRLREEGLEPFCLELHSNKTGKADVLAQFDRSLKFAAEEGAIDWDHRTAELERLRAALNGYTRALHRRTPCGLSAHSCFDYLLPRQAEATVKLEAWPALLETPAAKLEDTRQLARNLQERARVVMPLHDHVLGPLACEEWSPIWAERALEQIRALAGHAQKAAEATRELRTWLRQPGDSVSLAQLRQLRTLTESLLAPEPVGPAFATTPWNQLAADLDGWISHADGRAKLRSKLRHVHEPQPAGVVALPPEAWSTADFDTRLALARKLIALNRTAIEATRDLRTWLKTPRPTATRSELAQLVALSDSLLAAFPVAPAFTTETWSAWGGRFDRWIELVAERVKLRAQLVGYDEPKLLALELDTLKQKWDSGRSAWFLMKWLRVGYVRRHLRTARTDQVKPEVDALEQVLVASIRLRAVNAELASARVDAEAHLGQTIWSEGEPDVARLTAVRAWGATYEREWRESLEVLLHGFALSIPVPQEHHARFSAYIEHSKFRKRLVYYAAPKGNAPAAKLDATRAYGKLVLRPDTWCRAWLLERLIADFPHRCAPTMPEFLAEKGPALTRNRHIKGGIRFSKEGTDTERDYDILGWSNTAKLAEMRKKLEGLHTQARSLKKEAESLEQCAKGLKSGIILLERIALLPTYRVIDEAGISAELTAATDRRKELEATNDRWRALNDALQETLKEWEIVAQQEGDARETLGRTKADIEQWTKKRKEYANTFNAAALADFDWKPWEPQVEKFRDGEPLAITSFEKQIGRINRAIATALQRQKDRAAETGAPLTAAIARFLEATKSRGYSTTWRADASSAPALVAHLRKLIDENFSNQRKEFVAMMRKVLLDDLRIGEGDLQVQRRQNSERIAELNQTLAEIPYNEDTRIQIVTRPSREQAVLTYREKLDNCTKHSLALSDEQLQEKFKAVKALVTHIRDKRSDAEKGADPNNWDTFALLENKPGADPKDGEWHSDADGNSGGQKAKLACTIVAAAMAFQLKHTRTKQSNAFRLVMVDEIFSKSDDVNSAYALAIFEKFDFQLLLVTPRDGRLKLVQPYVGSFHLAQNPSRAASSLTSLTRVEVAGETAAPETDADAG